MGKTMRRVALNLYCALIGLASAGILAWAVFRIAGMPPSVLLRYAPTLLLFTVLCWLSNHYRVFITESAVYLMGTTAFIATLIVLPLPLALAAIAIPWLVSQIEQVARRTIKSWRSPAVNLGATTLANFAGGMLLWTFHARSLLFEHGPSMFLAVPAVVGLAIVWYAADTLVIGFAITFSSAENPLNILIRLGRSTYVGEMSLILVGVVLGVVWTVNPVLSLLVVAPVVFSVRSFQAVGHLRQETVEAVLKMAESIDYRDTGTYEHSQRLAELTERLSAKMGLTREHVVDVVLASRVHDLGKIGISNEILLKQGPLTPEERRVMEEHPVIGASILESYSAFRGSMDIVRHHHERWDGKGYPDGLAGEDIPVGSRIITVVDSYDAMTSDRPYRKGMTSADAVERLKAGMGSQFDPKVCALFIQMLIEDGVYVPPESPSHLRLVETPGLGQTG